MTAKELGKILNEMYTNAPRKEQVTMIYLFGIKYHNEIHKVGTREVVEASGINISYTAEISKALRLAQYVKPIK
jgi:5-methylcytosine-specific restriction protein B